MSFFNTYEFSKIIWNHLLGTQLHKSKLVTTVDNLSKFLITREAGKNAVYRIWKKLSSIITSLFGTTAIYLVTYGGVEHRPCLQGRRLRKHL